MKRRGGESKPRSWQKSGTIFALSDIFFVFTKVSTCATYAPRDAVRLQLRIRLTYEKPAGTTGHGHDYNKSPEIEARCSG